MTAVQSAARRLHQGGRKQTLTSSTTKYRFLATTNFEFVATRVFEKKRVVTRTVFLTNLQSLKIFPPSLAYEFSNAIHFFSRVCPKCYARAIRTMVFVLVQTKKFQRPIAVSSKERMKIVTGTFVNESKLWQKFCVEVSRGFHVLHS